MFLRLYFSIGIAYMILHLWNRRGDLKNIYAETLEQYSKTTAILSCVIGTILGLIPVCLLWPVYLFCDIFSAK